MSTVVVNVATAVASLPAGTPEVAAILISLHAGADTANPLQSQSVPPADPVTATFPSISDGDYTALAQAVAADGSPIGGAMQAAFTVTTPNVDRALPASVTVTVGP